MTGSWLIGDYRYFQTHLSLDMRWHTVKITQDHPHTIFMSIFILVPPIHTVLPGVIHIIWRKCFVHFFFSLSCVTHSPPVSSSLIWSFVTDLIWWLYIDIYRRCHSNILDIQSFRRADCDVDHCLVVAEVRERLSVTK